VNNQTERTLVLIKPDAVQRGLVGDIISRLESRGLNISGLKIIKIERAIAEQHYRVHKNRPFFPKLVDFITSSPVVAIVFQGRNAVEVTRNTMGQTNPSEATPGTIRGDFAIDIGRNLIHGSDSIKTAEEEILIFFAGNELLDYEMSTDPWITEP
jgi:nucleoside-diphosphate kinase